MAIDQRTMLERTLIAGLPADRRPTEQEVLTLATQLRLAFPVDEDAFQALIRDVHARLAITMDLGTFLTEDHVPWLAQRKADLDPFYWDRFRVYLGKLGWSPQVVNTMDRVSDEILDLAGDPTRGPKWARRGLVVGDVQSGKTATYTALACKAADAGYRLIVLLTGTLESLRRQTQERLDEGFVGLDSSEMLAQIRTNRAVGVGLIDQRKSAGVFTSRSRDFSKHLMTQLGFRLDAFQVPVLVVVKKNKRILENLESWLRSYNAAADGKIHAPMLLIDDEADSASINTNDSAADPTAINERLRAMLALFSRASYMGFTATPFANVFIEPETDHAMLGDDLFPRDYIYALEPPSNYVGPARVFTDDAAMVRNNDDADPVLPHDHKNGHPVEGLPESLREAVNSFLLANAIRDLRGEERTHRSMLVNVSRFTAVQDRIAQLVDLAVRDIQRDIRNFSRLGVQEATRVPSLEALKQTWLREYDNAGFDWAAVLDALNAAAQPVVVKAVNQRTGAASLDYKANREHGLRVIAVGGNSLSRGLTLEGLTISYFYRNSQMYDTLLQMGRWFGYRDGYEDLCRVWLSEEAVHWYTHISAAIAELREELKRMRRLDLTPRDFGLKVRGHPDALIVTARNKMRAAHTLVRQISLSGQGIETARLRTNPAVLAANARLADDFLNSLEGQGSPPAWSQWDNAIWRDVSKATISRFLREFQAHPLAYQFQSEKLADFLGGTSEPRLQLWDVVAPKGSHEPPESLGPVMIKPSLRRVVVKKEIGSVLISGSRARVGSRGIEREGLTVEEYQKALESKEEKNISDADFRRFRSKPLLLIHLLKGYIRQGQDRSNDEDYLKDGSRLVAIGLSFPLFDDSEIAGRVEYVVNAVEWRSMIEAEADDDIAADDDDDD